VTVADPLIGRNGPRPRRRTGRNRRTVRNIASKRRTFPAQLVSREAIIPPATTFAPERSAGRSAPGEPVTVAPGSGSTRYQPQQTPPLALPTIRPPDLSALSSLVAASGNLAQARSFAATAGARSGGGGGGGGDPNLSVEGTAERKRFATAILRKLGAPTSAANMNLMLAWMQAEGTDARFNPLATTQPAPGATNFNSVGVKNYRSFNQGVAMSVRTLLNGYYGSIVRLLRSSASPFDTARAIAQSPWGTGKLVLQVLRNAR
jgi:hypothetical protein